jgi:phosphate transport system substrate-binding protein
MLPQIPGTVRRKPTMKAGTFPMKTALLLTLSLASFCACSKNPAPTGTSGEGAAKGTGEAQQEEAIATIVIDGSSTVSPISEAVAEEFQKSKGNKVRVTVAVSGTGGGFKKFCASEIQIAGASRPIKPTEVEACAKANLEYIELPVAYDGLSVVLHPSNTFAKTLTVAELKKMWEPESQGKVTKWSQINAQWPDKEFRLFGPDVDSGTYDYFTQAIVGKEHSSRGDYSPNADDNVLVKGVTSDPMALGFFGFAYYKENADKLTLAAIDDGKDDNGKGAIQPSPETIANGTYQPLSRPIFIYVSKAAAARGEVREFIDFFLTKGRALVAETGYIPLPDRAYELAIKRFAEGKAGSVFGGHGSKVGLTVEALLAAE